MSSKSLKTLGITMFWKLLGSHFLLSVFVSFWSKSGQPEPDSRARPDSTRTGGPDGDCGTHKAAENGQRHNEEVRSSPNRSPGRAGWAGRTAEPGGYGLQVRLAVRLATRFVYRPARQET